MNYILVSIILALTAFNAYCMGHNDGWDLGFETGKADLFLKGNGRCLYRNGNREY